MLKISCAKAILMSDMFVIIALSAIIDSERDANEDLQNEAFF